MILIDQGYETMEGASGDDWISGAQSMRAYMRGAEIAGIMAEHLRSLGWSARSQINADSHVLHIPRWQSQGLGLWPLHEDVSVRHGGAVESALFSPVGDQVAVYPRLDAGSGLRAKPSVEAVSRKWAASARTREVSQRPNIQERLGEGKQ